MVLFCSGAEPLNFFLPIFESLFSSSTDCVLIYLLPSTIQAAPVHCLLILHAQGALKNCKKSFTQTRLLNKRFPTTVSGIHRIGHDRHWQMPDLFSEFDVERGELERQLRDALTKAQDMHSKHLLAAKDFSPRVEILDADFQSLVNQNAMVVVQPEEDGAATIRQHNEQEYLEDEHELPHPHASYFQEIRSSARSLFFCPENPNTSTRGCIRLNADFSNIFLFG
jgi:hypothetical protein